MGKGYFSVLGFILFVLAFLSIMLDMVGLSFRPLAFLDKVSFGFLIKIIILVGGLILLYIDSSWQKKDWDDEEIL